MIPNRKYSLTKAGLVSALSLVALLLSPMALGGCSRPDRMVGTYLGGGDSKLVLLADGTFKAGWGEGAEEEITIKGKYRVNGNKITLSPDWISPVLIREGTSSEPVTFTIDGETITDPVRDTHYTKQAKASGN